VLISEGMKRYTIACDLDGVLANSIENFLKIIEDEKAIKKASGEIRHYDFTIELGLPRDYINLTFKKVWDDYEKIKPVDNNIALAIKKIHEKADIHIVTGSVGMDKSILEWLRVNNIVYDKFVHLKNEKEKLDVNADFFIEDNPDIITELHKSGRKVIAYERSWNVSLANNGMAFAKNWQEVLEIISRSIPSTIS